MKVQNGKLNFKIQENLFVLTNVNILKRPPPPPPKERKKRRKQELCVIEISQNVKI